MFQEALKVTANPALQTATQGITWKDWVPNLINALAAFGSLGAAFASWKTLGQLRLERKEEKELSAPILQFIKADAAIADLTKPFEPIYLKIHFANARKSNLLTANHIGFVINEEKKVYTYYTREFPCGGNTSEEIMFNLRLMQESQFKGKAWSCVFFIELETPHGLSRKEVCFIRVPGPDGDNKPSSEIQVLIGHPHLIANYYRLEYIPDEERAILASYLSTFKDPKWSKFCSKFEDYLKASWE